MMNATTSSEDNDEDEPVEWNGAHHGPLSQTKKNAAVPQQQKPYTPEPTQFWSSEDDETDGDTRRHGTVTTAAAKVYDKKTALLTDDGRDGLMAAATTANGLHRKPKTRVTVRLPRLRRRRDESLYDRYSNNVQVEDDDEENRRHGSDEESVDDWSLHSDTNNINNTPARLTTPFAPLGQQLTEHDIALCQALDLDYERAIEDRHVAWTARYQSVRQSTLVSVVFMILLILTGTTFFLHQADSFWTISEGLLFSIYTITTVGYGHLDMPDTPTFQLYVIFYIFVGIAMLTILVAQVYQCIALEASRVVTDAGDAQTRRKNSMRVWLEARAHQQRNNINASSSDATPRPESLHGTTTTTLYDKNVSPNANSHHTSNNVSYSLDDDAAYNTAAIWDWADCAVWLLQIWDRLRRFLRENEFGRGISVILPFAILVALGAGVIGPLEGWTAIEATYFAVVSLTTVGFGDYYPKRTASIWFCCLWLPFSVGFMSLYLANVAAFYIRLSDRNVARIGRVLRKRLHGAKERAEKERRAILKRAMRGQQNDQGETIVGPASSIDDFTLATEAAESAQRPLNEVQEDITGTIVSFDDLLPSQQSPHRSTNRMKGFDTVPTLDDNGNLQVSTTAAAEHSDQDGSPRRTFDLKSLNNSDGSSSLYKTGGGTSYQRQRILQNSLKHMELVAKIEGSNISGKKIHRETMTMKTMSDVLRTVHRNNNVHGSMASGNDGRNSSIARSISSQSTNPFSFLGAGPESEFLSVRASRTVLHHDRKTIRKKPSFALRALVQERFAEIIATDVAGFQSSMEIKDYTMAVTLNSLKETAEKWLVPRRARKAFRAVAFETLYFVGEHGLVTRGSEALFALTPFEFHEIFSPLVAAFDDAETMELWLEHTQALAEVDLAPSQESRPFYSGNFEETQALNDPIAAVALPQSLSSKSVTVDNVDRISPLSETTEQTSVTSPSLPDSPRTKKSEIDLPDIA